MTLNAITVLPAVFATTYALLAAPLAARWVLVRAVPIAVGGTVLAVSTGLAVLRGAWLAMSGSSDLDEAKADLGETLIEKQRRPYDEQVKGYGVPGKKTVLVSLDDMTPEEFQRALAEIAGEPENA